MKNILLLLTLCFGCACQMATPPQTAIDPPTKEVNDKTTASPSASTAEAEKQAPSRQHATPTANAPTTAKSDFKKITLPIGVSLEVPSDFEEMPVETFYLKYPQMDYDASDAYANKPGEKSILIEHNKKPLPSGDFIAYAKRMTASLKDAPQVKIWQQNEKNYGGKRFWQVEFSSQSVDAPIYNWLLCTELNGRPLIFTINCLKSQYGSWNKDVEHMIQSIAIK